MTTDVSLLLSRSLNAEGESLLLRDDVPTDGRRRRSLKSRGRIVDAMVALVRSGNLSPSAETVSQLAEVSLRTVFRHFEDMDSLYREMALSVEAEILPVVMSSLPGDTWREKLQELIVRRSEIYEHLLPFRRAASLRRHQSPMLAEQNRALCKLEREILRTVAPSSILDRPRHLEALDLLLSFDSWLRLRLEQGLDIAEACETMRVAALALTDAAEAQAS